MKKLFKVREALEDWEYFYSYIDDGDMQNVKSSYKDIEQQISYAQNFISVFKNRMACDNKFKFNFMFLFCAVEKENI